jgi:hypothetical protein
MSKSTEDSDCEGFGTSWFEKDIECEKCDAVEKCKEKTQKLLGIGEGSKKEINFEELLTTARRLNKKTDLLDWIEENDIDVVPAKLDNIAKILSKVEKALRAKIDADEDKPKKVTAKGAKKDMAKKKTVVWEMTEDMYESLIERLDLLDEKLSAPVEAPANKPRKGSMTKEQKAEFKATLVDDMPYSKADLEAMPNNHLKILASGIDIPSFGVKKVDIIKEIIKAQK